MRTELEHRHRAIDIAADLHLIELRMIAVQLELAELRMEAGRLREAYAEEDAAADVARLLQSVGIQAADPPGECSVTR